MPRREAVPRYICFSQESPHCATRLAVSPPFLPAVLSPLSLELDWAWRVTSCWGEDSPMLGFLFYPLLGPRA